MFRAKGISWRAIIAGAVTAAAVSMILALLGMALGFTVINPMSNDPFRGLGMTIGLWSIVSILISLVAGAFMAGYFSRVRGGEHGFMVWATILVLGSVLGTMAVGSAVRAASSAAYEVGSDAVSAVSTVGGGVAHLAANAIDSVQDAFDFDTDDIQADVASVLRDTGVPTLQPEYLRRQMREARSDLRTAINRIAINTDDYDTAIGTFIDHQNERINTITADVDRDAAVRALMTRRGMSREEANQAVDNALIVYNRSVDRVQDALTEARQEVQDARAYITAVVDDARVKADEVASSMAKSALALAATLVVGAILSWLAGMWGANHAIRMYPRSRTVIEETIVREPVETVIQA